MLPAAEYGRAAAALANAIPRAICLVVVARPAAALIIPRRPARTLCGAKPLVTDMC